jgi:anti-sigma factor RsiW
MSHIKEEQISAYVDRQLDAAENRAVESHLRECAHCSGLMEEMSELTQLFREAERAEPSPFLWNRISANIDANHKERISTRSWSAAVIEGLRRYTSSTGLAAAALGILMFAGVAVYRQIETGIALAKIEQAYQSLAAQNPEANNPFSAETLLEFDSNPFSKRLPGRKN